VDAEVRERWIRLFWTEGGGRYLWTLPYSVDAEVRERWIRLSWTKGGGRSRYGQKAWGIPACAAASHSPAQDVTLEFTR
jgi:hypothetical protein